jgi:hypothetical protein
MKNSITRQIVAAIVLGIGFGVVWGFGLAGIGGFVSSLFGPTHVGDYEDIVVDQLGKPVIQTRMDNDWEDIKFRALDGQEIPLMPREDYNLPTTLAGPYRAPRFFNYPISWRQRIVGTTGGEDPPVSWVLMRDDRRPGRAWFVGHQQRSKQLVGYIGREGLRSSLPPEGEQFNVGNRTFDYTRGVFASTGNGNPGYLDYANAPLRSSRDGSIQPWMIYLSDGDSVEEIDLRTRKVRELGKYNGLTGLGILQFTSPEAERTENTKSQNRLAIRSRDRVIVFNTFDNTQNEFKIPVAFWGEQFGVSMVGDGQLLLHLDRGRWERGAVTELLWINREGMTQDQQTVQLVRWTNQDKPSDAVMPAIVAPSLLPWLLGMFVVAPISMLQEYHTDTYLAGVTEVRDAAWMGLVVVAVLSIILTAIVYRWQKQYSRPHTFAWTTFVFLTTLPGFFAYWAMHRREPLAACPHCKHEVPRNREACASCNETFAEPKLLGTEVFA